MRAAHFVAALAIASVLVYGGFVLGQQSAPTDYRLVSEDVLATIDLATEIDSVQGRELRLSSAVIAPGGHVGVRPPFGRENGDRCRRARFSGRCHGCRRGDACNRTLGLPHA